MMRSHPPEVRAQARRLWETSGLTNEEVGARLELPASTVGTWRRTERWTRPEAARRPAPLVGDPHGAPEGVPPHLAEIHAALTRRELSRDELIGHAQEALAIVMAEALIGRDPRVHRRAQTLARTVVCLKALPERAARGGAGGLAADDHHAGLATFDEINAAIDEIDRRFRDYCERGEVEAVPGGAAAAPPAGGAAPLDIPGEA